MDRTSGARAYQGHLGAELQSKGRARERQEKLFPEAEGGCKEVSQESRSQAVAGEMCCFSF